MANGDSLGRLKLSEATTVPCACANGAASAMRARKKSRCRRGVRTVRGTYDHLFFLSMTSLKSTYP